MKISIQTAEEIFIISESLMPDLSFYLFLKTNRLLMIIMIIININISAQSSIGSITGIIKTASGADAYLVNIILIGTSLGSITDSTGRYNIENIQPGKYVLRASSVGYKTEERTIEVTASQTTVVPDIILTVKAKELKEILVEDTKNRYVNVESEYVTKLPLKNMENPQSYSSSSPELFKEQNIVDYTSALKTIPGGVVSSEDPVGVLKIFMRGFSTLPYIRNGIFTLNPSGGDLQATERIEIIRGPSGSVFGSAGVSYGGLINKVSKKPFKQKAINAGLLLGSFNLQRFTADVNLPLSEDNSLLFRFNAALHSEGSFQDYGYRRDYLMAPSLLYKISSRINFLFEAEINVLDHSVQSYFLGAPALGIKRIDEIKRDYFKSYSSANLIQQPSYLNNYFGELTYALSDEWSIKTSLAIADFKLNGGNIIPLFVNDTLMIRRLYDYTGQYNTVTIHPYISGNFKIGGLKNKLAAGLDFKSAEATISTYLNTNADSINYTNDAATYLNAEKARSNYNILTFTNENVDVIAFFISDVLYISDHLNLMLGLRYESYNHKGLKNFYSGVTTTKPYVQGSTAPQAGITYQLIKDRISFYANYMKGFNNAAPNAQGQTFRSEQAVQAEGGIKLNLFSGNLTSTFSYYHILVKDKVRRDPDNPLFSIQDGTQVSRGVDIDMRITPFAGFSIAAGYAYNESKFTKADASIEAKRPLGTPKHTANIWGSYTFTKLLEGLGIGAGAVYSDDYFYDDRNTLLIPSYSTLRASIFYTMSTFRITIGLENLGDRRYWDYIGTPQMPSRLTAALSLQF